MQIPRIVHSSLRTYTDSLARTTARVCVYTLGNAYGTWSHIITYIKGASYTSNGNARVYRHRGCMCRFFDDTLDRECTYILFHFHENQWKCLSGKKSHGHPSYDYDVITLVSSSSYMLKLLRDSITLKIIVKKAVKLKLLKKFVDERKCWDLYKGIRNITASIEKDNSKL